VQSGAAKTGLGNAANNSRIAAPAPIPWIRASRILWLNSFQDKIPLSDTYPLWPFSPYSEIIFVKLGEVSDGEHTATIVLDILLDFLRLPLATQED